MKEEEKMKGKHPSQENKHFQKPSKRLLLFFFNKRNIFIWSIGAQVWKPPMETHPKEMGTEN